MNSRLTTIFWAVVALVTTCGPARAEGRPVRLVNNGFCAGMSWITLLPNESVILEIGPDFDVYRVTGPNKMWWSVYSGRYAQVSNSTGSALIQSNGVTVRSAIVEGAFQGYLASNRNGDQNHFFGSVFKNDRSDSTFFAKVEFGAEAQNKCKRYQQP